MLIFVLGCFFTLVFSLLSIAFYTLFERKVLGLAQMRMGPNKVSLMGFTQPLLDGLKLFLKEAVSLSGKSFILLFVPSFLILFVMFQVWSLVPTKFSCSDYFFSILVFLLVLGLLVYNSILVGVISNSKYGFLGGMRNACQSVSYEISLSLQLLGVCLVESQLLIDSSSSLALSLLFLFLWWISCVCECNRAPFDFAEGESELISGFNIEYSSVSFVFIFLGEYGMMLCLSLMTSSLFFNSSLVLFFFFFHIFVIFRASFPRYRYDLLMSFCWLSILPFSAAVFFLLLVVV